VSDPFFFLSQPGFHRGVLLGVGAASIAALLAVAMRRRARPAPLAGIAFAAAGTAGLFWVEHPSAWLAIGIGALLAGSLLGRELPRAVRPLWPLLTIPGAWMIAERAIPFAEPWARALIGVGIVVGGALVGDLDRRRGAGGITVTMLAATMLGIYATVPDTEEALVLLGVMVPVALLGFPFAVARLGSAGGSASVGLLAWIIAHGGRSRESAIIGGVACLGIFVVEPLAALLMRRREHPASLGSTLWLIGAHLAVVFVASRIVGIRDRLSAAVTGAVLVGVVALLAATTVLRRPLLPGVGAGDGS